MRGNIPENEFVVPCPCQAGDAKIFSYKDLRLLFEKFAEDVGYSVKVASVAVSGCCVDDFHPSGIKWLVDFESAAGLAKVDDDLDNAMITLTSLLKGEIVGYGANFVRTAIPVSTTVKKPEFSEHVVVPSTAETS